MPRPDESLGGARPSHVSWCAARELTRVAVAETESAWLDAALGKTLRELGALVANKCPGDAPDAPPTEGDLVPIDAAVVDSALCDAQHLGELLPSAVQPTAIETPSSA